MKRAPRFGARVSSVLLVEFWRRRLIHVDLVANTRSARLRSSILFRSGVILVECFRDAERHVTVAVPVRIGVHRKRFGIKRAIDLLFARVDRSRGTLREPSG